MSLKHISNAEYELRDLKEKSANNSNDSQLKDKIKNAEHELHDLEKNLVILTNQISGENEIITDLEKEKDELIKRSLMKLHSKLKKDYRKVNADHDRYVELYKKAREKRLVLERRMMNLKFLVYQTYQVRLV